MSFQHALPPRARRWCGSHDSRGQSRAAPRFGNAPAGRCRSAPTPDDNW